MSFIIGLPLVVDWQINLFIKFFKGIFFSIPEIFKKFYTSLEVNKFFTYEEVEKFLNSNFFKFSSRIFGMIFPELDLVQFCFFFIESLSSYYRFDLFLEGFCTDYLHNYILLRSDGLYLQSLIKDNSNI